MRDRGICLDFFKRMLVVNNVDNSYEIESTSVSVNLEESGLREGEKGEFKQFLSDFSEVFSDKHGLTHVSWHEINTGSNAPVTSEPYRYDKIKQKIIDYTIQKMLKEDIMPIESPYASHVVL